MISNLNFGLILITTGILIWILIRKLFSKPPMPSPFEQYRDKWFWDN